MVSVISDRESLDKNTEKVLKQPVTLQDQVTNGVLKH